jgi:hypothetical protein
MLITFLVVLIVSCTAHTAEALRLDWLPNDANSPLPLSTVYRAKLKTLCDLYGEMGEEKAKTLIKPAAKVPTLMKMCVKLKLDEENIAIGEAEVWRTQFWYWVQLVLLGCLVAAVYFFGVLWYLGSAIPGALWHNAKYTVNGWLGKNNTFTTRPDSWGLSFGKAAGISGSNNAHFDSRIPGVKMPAGITLDTAEAKAAYDFLVQQRLMRFEQMQGLTGSGGGSSGNGAGSDAAAVGGAMDARGALRRKAAAVEMGLEDRDGEERESDSGEDEEEAPATEAARDKKNN